jgi:Ca-activated chloride channel family protein
VRSIDAGGSTNLSGGWLKALEMLSTTGRPDALRRIVVLTDGHANAGITGIDQLGPIVAGGRREGITSTFIGFDDGYDENLLAGLADAGAGNDYWCAGPDQAPAVFSAEFEGLASVVAQNVSVSIEPAPEVAAVTVLNDFPLTNHDNGSIEVALGDAYGDETRRVLFSLHLRPVPTGGHLDVATLTIRWASTSGDIALHTLSVPVRIEIGRPGQHDPGADPRVAEEVVILHAARARHEARNFAENGDFESAARLLSDAADNLERIGTRPTEVTELRADAAELTDRRWSPADSKRIYSTSRSITKGRRQRFDHKPSEPDEV